MSERGRNMGKMMMIEGLMEAAAERGHTAILKILLSMEKDADLDYLLCLAASGGHLETIRFLLSQGAVITSSAVNIARNQKYYGTATYLKRMR